MTEKRPFFLLTNDDGIHSPGLRHLWDAAREIADIAIVAPHLEKSGCGTSITWSRPLSVCEHCWEQNTVAWSINDGTPADCIKMALNILLPREPDLILSGVNGGSNAGRTILYSGTIGGVIEGVLHNIPGIAFSFSDFRFPSIGSVKSSLKTIIEHFLRYPLPSSSFINANYPANCEKNIAGIRIARQGKGRWMEDPDRRIHPEGHIYYWLGGKWSTPDEEPDSDVALLKQGYITITPIHIADLTDHRLMREHQTIQNLNW